MSRTKKNGTVFLDLKECAIREIFKYFDEYGVYFILGWVCHQFKRYVDEYTRLLGVFCRTSGSKWCPDFDHLLEIEINVYV